MNPREMLIFKEKINEIDSYLRNLPAKSLYIKRDRNADIFWSLVSGECSVKDCCEKFNLTKDRIYQIFKKQCLIIEKANELYNWW